MSAPTENPFLPPGTQLETAGVDGAGEITVTYRLTALDHLWFNACNVQTRLVPQSVLLLASAYLASSIAPDGLGLLIFVGIYIANSILQLLLMSLMVLLARNGRLLTDYRTGLADAGLSVSTRYVKSLYYWNGIDRVRSFPWIIAVYVNANSAVIIPKRAFSGDAQQARFLALIAERQLDE